jgi:hypothetical protein
MTTSLLPVLLSIACMVPQDAAPKAPADAPSAPASKEPSRRPRKADPAPAPSAPRSPVEVPKDLAPIIATAVERLVAMQEDPGQWPYEGVYRVGGKIPVGYRIGGTGICGEALLRASGYASDPARVASIGKAIAFVCEGIKEPLMSPDDYDGGYDVRGWGMCYGARFLLAAQRAGAVPEAMRDQTKAATEWYLAALAKLEIPKVGGWTYSRQPGRDTPCPASPFMTAPCLETLFAAKAQGYAVDPAMVDRALKALNGTTAKGSGYVDYSGGKGIKDKADQIPGAVGRMCAAEVAMTLAGRGSPEGLERAIEAFCAHWDALEVRRAKTGTHVAPYGVAPYYFYFAHYYAAQAIARFAQKMPDVYRPIPDEASLKIKAMSARRRQIVEMIAMEKTRLKQAFDDELLASLRQMIALLEAQRDEVEARLNALLREAGHGDMLALLQTAPGVGPRIAATLAADMPELGHIGRRAAASLAGLAPHIQQSGINRGRASISGGRPCVRTALYMAALVASRSHPRTKAEYKAMLAAGKPPKVAFVAIARKLLVALNQMVTEKKPWTEDQKLQVKN